MTVATLNEVIQEEIAAEMGRVRVGCVGVIDSYNHNDQVASVQPVVETPFDNPEGGEDEFVQPPVIPNVPVMFPSSGSFSITWPLESGDTVYLCQADRSHDEWQNQGGDQTTPRDRRRFDLTDSFAFPQGRSPSNALSDVDSNALVVSGDTIKLGSSSGTNPISIAKDAVNWISQNIVNFFNTQFIQPFYNTHLHVDPISGTTGPPNTPFTQTMSSPTESDFSADTTEAK